MSEPTDLTFQVVFVHDPTTRVVHVYLSTFGVLVCEQQQADGLAWVPLTKEQLAAAGEDDTLPLCPTCFNPEK